ncbi:molybdopterin molybdotransferase MoeA [Zavarzinia aquatilis]|uniref:molybdopterin molybdotransferase MoeA n=1 Tax=Zavarzinia aquatilis TaxID=2211142 RepID=UPI0014038D7F|nr:molybdopterin molybdotransferase MoeA [Zavarzinia aquatilis]
MSRQPLLTVDAALALIGARIAVPAGCETVPVAGAAGRVLARPVLASEALPAADNSAVDGYALHGTGDNACRLVPGRAAAGHPFPHALAAGEAVRILTGAVVPDGTSAVLMQEQALIEGDILRWQGDLRPGANIRRKGEVLRPGEAALPAELRLTPVHLGLLADLGVTEVGVRPRLRVALLSSGDELRPAGAPKAAHQVTDSNRPMLRGFLADLGCEVKDGPILPDDRAAIAQALREAAASADLVITTAGMSVGEEDHIPAILHGEGEMIFHRLALKPGRPMGLGLLGGTPVLGLPGNPGAVAVTFALIGQMLVRHLAGEAPRPLPRYTVPAGFAYEKPAGDRALLPARLNGGKLERVARNAAGNLAWGGDAEGFADIAEATTSIAPGDPVGFIPFAGALR